jgi:hypothetical protein
MNWMNPDESLPLLADNLPNLRISSVSSPVGEIPPKIPHMHFTTQSREKFYHEQKVTTSFVEKNTKLP